MRRVGIPEAFWSIRQNGTHTKSFTKHVSKPHAYTKYVFHHPAPRPMDLHHPIARRVRQAGERKCCDELMPQGIQGCLIKQIRARNNHSRSMMSDGNTQKQHENVLFAAAAAWFPVFRAISENCMGKTASRSRPQHTPRAHDTP